MPTRQQHLNQASDNQDFYASINLSAGRFLDWAITGLFYSAPHYVDAYLATRGTGSGVHPASHQDRGLTISREILLRNIYGDYQELKNRSEDARYRLLRFTPAQVQQLHDNEFLTVRNTIVPHL